MQSFLKHRGKMNLERPQPFQKPSCVLEARNESLHRRRKAGFAVAPILYLLTLAGVAAGVLFSNYSQILRSNITITNTNTAKNDLSGSLTTLAATSAISSDSNVFCPPGSTAMTTNCATAPQKMVLFGEVAAADTGKLPANYGNASSSGSPWDVGVFGAGAGLKQLDPWGHFYIYCRWENAKTDPDQKAIALISAGANATLETTCGDDTAKGDDLVQLVTVGAAIQRAAIWQETGTAVEYGQTGSKVVVGDDGTIKAQNILVLGTATFGSLALTAPLPIESGGTGAANAISARSNLGSGVVGDALFVATTATGARNTLGATNIGHYLFGGTSLVAETASLARLDLLGAGAVGNEMFVSTTATAGRNVLGATEMGHYLFSSASFDGTVGPMVRANLLGSGAIGDAVFTSGDTDTAQTVLGATTVGKAVFTAASTTAGRTALGGGAVGSPLFTAPDQITAWGILGLTGTTGVSLDVSVTGSAGSVAGANITGTVPIAHGGTGASDESSALDNLFGGDLAPGSALNVGRIGSNSIDSSKLTNVVSSGTYNSVTVDAAGRVTSGTFTPLFMDMITDGLGDTMLASATNGGQLLFYTASNLRMTITASGNVGIGIADPIEKLHIFGGNALISGPSDDYRSLLFATTTDQKRWEVAADDSTETGFGDTGSDFVIRRYTDAGAPVTALTIDRTTGNALFAGSVAATGGFLGYFTGTFDGTFTGSVGSKINLGPSAGDTNPQRTGEAGTGLFSDASNSVGIATGGLSRIYITATGSVGIGTTTPAQMLDVNGNINVGAITNGYYIANTKILHQPDSDPTSIGVGPSTLAAQTGSGFNNTALGRQALMSTTTGTDNTAVGHGALDGNTTGSENVAVGSNAVGANTWGNRNIGLGVSAVAGNTQGYGNIGIGYATLQRNQRGGNNIAIGSDTLRYTSSDVSYNVAVGQGVLRQSWGHGNTALGYAVLSSTTTYTGSYNVAIGYEVGKTTLVSGSNNILIGTSSAVDTPLSTTSNFLNIGNTIYGDLSLGSISLGSPTVTSGASLDISTRTDSVLLPKGGDALRPVGVGGMIRFNTDSNTVEVYQGTGWLSLALTATAGTTIYLGPDAANTSPSRSDDITTGLYSDTASTVKTAISGIERLAVTTTGLNVNGSVNLANLTDYIAITGTKVLLQPASDTTSIGVGPRALASQTATNLYNTAVGQNALAAVSTGQHNTAVGGGALRVATSGAANAAFGYAALYNATTAGANAAFGKSALQSLSTGSYNTAIGTQALFSNQNGGGNTAVGTDSLYNDVSGANNAALGNGSGRTLTTGSRNSIVGAYVASTTLTTGSSNIWEVESKNNMGNRMGSRK
ncbi:MAG: hypothetical protein PHW63_05860 [Alphaproteobacteria bacterium]|nr:hypothetical protein [Alphaproteobacteria bacterium]